MKRSSFAPCALAVLAAGLLALAGCSGSAGSSTSQHQVVSSTQDCTFCHEEKETYDIDAADVANILETGTTVTVETDESTVVVARATFINVSGSKYVPREYTTASVSDGQATIELDEGVWVLCLDEGDGSTCVIVSVSAGGDDATISL